MAQRDCETSLRACLDQASNVHVFHWSPERERRTLADGMGRWKAYLDIVKASAADRHLLLEFVKEDSADQLLADAKTLISLCR
jgi:hypothetical protein